MNAKSVKILLLFISFLVYQQVYSQVTYANREWVRETPIVGNTIYHTSSIVSANKLYVTGNIINGNGDTDIMTIKYDNNGDTLWMKTFAGSNGGDDYGVELKAQGSSIFVVAASENTGTGYDYCILKYAASTGNLIWSFTWNGVGNAMDIPASINFDPSGGAIYIGGGSEATNGFSDYGVISVSSAGNLNWATYYDFNDLHDGATALVSKGNSIFVTGGSAATIADWDIATIKINKSTGNIISTNRTDVPGASIVEAFAMTTDTLNNVYITGYSQSGDKNIQTIKLDSTLSLQWITNFEGDYDDVGNDIGIDDAGNVYITGYSEEISGKFNAITIKYSENGDTLWTQLFGNTVTENGVVSRKMAVEPSGEVYITGTSLNGGLNSFAFVKYNSDGQLKIAKEYQADNLDNDSFEISVDGNDVYITGFTETISGRRMTSIKYSLTEKDTAQYYDTTGTPKYMNRDLIVQVDTSLINFDQINHLEKEYWELGEIFDAGFVTDMNRVLEGPCGHSECAVKVYRIFTRLKTTDTTTTSRLGQEIRIPNFWSTFVFEFPDGVDITEAGDSLNLLMPAIHYVHFNFVIQLTSAPDDPDYELQYSLHPINNPDFDSTHINVEGAWDYEVGQSFVKVGVLDNGIYYNNPEFDDSTGNTKIVGGWNFQSNTNIFASGGTSAGSHGTSVTGIIGANRNDGIGMAGIAGGNDSISNPGVSIYALKIYADEVFFSNPISYVANAIVEASIESTDSLGYGLHIMNNSWALNISDPDLQNQSNFNLLTDATHLANRAHVTFVVARGNEGFDSPTYPAIIDDDWILSVGGTGADGNYYDGQAPSDGNNVISSYGRAVDVAAPASGWAWAPYTNDIYIYFGGTSAAAPHVTGTVALLMSYHNYNYSDPQNLAPEDAEFLVQLSADDVESGGYDDYTGYGRLNAGRAMSFLAEENCYIIHYGVSDSTSFTSTITQVGSGDSIKIYEFYSNTDGNFQASNTFNYKVDTYKVTFSFILPGTLPEDTLRAAWARHSSSNLFGLFGNDHVIFPRERIEIIDVDENSATIVGYAYRVFQFGGELGWMPYNPTMENLYQASFTVFRCDTNLITADIPEKEDMNSGVTVYPNPTNDSQLLVIEGEEGLDLNIKLYDVSGKLAMEVFNGKTSGQETLIPVSLANLPKGLYFYMIILGDETKQVKIIKQ